MQTCPPVKSRVGRGLKTRRVIHAVPVRGNQLYASLKLTAATQVTMALTKVATNDSAENMSSANFDVFCGLNYLCVFLPVAQRIYFEYLC